MSIGKMFLAVLISFLCVYITGGVLIDIITGHGKRAIWILGIAIMLMLIVYFLLEGY